MANSVIAGITTPPFARTARVNTAAPSADSVPITCANARASLLKVVSPLKSAAWYSALERFSLLSTFSDVPTGISNGFFTGISTRINSTLIPDNHKSALLHPEAVELHIRTELNKGRYSGPFSPNYLTATIGPFRTAPLGVVSKPNSDKFCIIQDLSYPRNDPSIDSVNSGINSADFPCEWGTFAQCYFAVASCPAGTQVAVFDVDSAYRNIPIAPADQAQFCVAWKDQVYVNHCVPFGAASSAGLFGRIADAFVAIIQKFGAEQVLKWVDDIIFFCFPINSTEPYQYAYTSDLVSQPPSFWACHYPYQNIGISPMLSRT